MENLWLFPPEQKNLKKRNIGEWSELLAVLNCLLFPKITIDSQPHTITDVEYSGSSIPTSNISDLSLDAVSNRIYSAITSNTGAAGAFSIDDDFIMKRLQKIGLDQLKGASSREKQDLVLRTQESGLKGFNVKSLLGGNPSIINASQMGTIKYQLKNPKATQEEINATLSEIEVFSKKISYLRTVCDEINSCSFTSESYQGFLSNLDEYAYLYFAEWLIDFYENKRQIFTEDLSEQSWLGSFLLSSITKITPGSQGADECGLALLHNTRLGPRLAFTMGSEDFTQNLPKFVRWDRPSFTRHKAYMLGSIDSEFCFRLPIQIRLKSKIAQLFKEQE
jgi:hypothetical protein